MTDEGGQASDGDDLVQDTEVQTLFEEAHQVLEDFVATLSVLREKIEMLHSIASEVSSDSIDELSESLHAMTERAPSVDHELKQVDQSIAEGLRDVISSIDDRVHAAGAGASSTTSRISDEERELGEVFSRLQVMFGDVLARITTAYNEHLQDLGSAQRALTERLGQIFNDRLAAGTHQIVGALGEFSSRAEAIMQQLIELLSQALTGLAEALEKSVHSAQSRRMPTQLALDAVKLVLDPLMKEVGRVKDLADSLGVSV